MAIAEAPGPTRGCAIAHATIRDVALRAGVSVASVSRALNGLGNVRGATRDRVVAAAAALGYVPHAGARSLSLARAHAIGVVLPDLHGEFFSELLRGMDAAATRCGYLLLLSTLHGADHPEALRAMRGRVDGLLVMAPHIEPDALGRAIPAGLPTILVNAPAHGGRPALRLDNAAAAATMVAHLVATGRRRLLHIAGPADNLDAQERAEGFRRAVAGHLPGAGAEVMEGDFREGSGEAAARRILADPDRYDAVFAANDAMAIGCLHVLREAGLAVPGRVAVAGFDDVPLARYLSLTTMGVRIAEVGGRAVDRLVAMLEGKPDAGGDELHHAELIVRASTMTHGSHR